MKIARVVVPQRHISIDVRHDSRGVRLGIGVETVWLRPALATELADALVDAAEHTGGES